MRLYCLHHALPFFADGRGNAVQILGRVLRALIKGAEGVQVRLDIMGTYWCLLGLVGALLGFIGA